MSAANTTIHRINERWTKATIQAQIQIVALTAITLLAATLRFYRLGDWSFWIDEIFTLGRIQAHYSSVETTLQHIPPNSNWVSVSLLSTAAALKAFGVSEWSARLVPALIGITSIPILFFPIRRLLGTSIALVAMLLLAVSPWHIYWSQNARFYTALLLFYSLALFAFYFGIERNRPRYILLFIGLTYLAASERLLAMLIMPVVLSYLFFVKILPFEKPAGYRTRNILLTLLPVIIGGAVELYTLLISGTSRFFGDFVFFGNSIENPFAQAIFIVFELGIPLVTLSFFCGLYLLIEKSRIGLFLLLGAVVPFGIVILLTPFMFTEERYVFVTLTSWLVLGAIAVKELIAQSKEYGKLLALGVLLLLVADAIGEDLMYFRANDGNRRDYKGAFALVQERSKEGDIVVSTYPELGEYYLDQEVLSWTEIEPEAVVRSDRRVWFVIIRELSWFWNDQGWPSQYSELIEVKYLRRPDDAALHIYLYDPARN